MKHLIFDFIVPKSQLVVSFFLALTFNLFCITNCFAFAVEELKTDYIVGALPDGTPVYATLPGVPIHEEITMAALNKSAFQFPEVTKADGSPAHFSEQAIYILQLNNLLADRDQNSIEVHFDNESLNQGNRRLFNLRQKVVKEAKAGNYLQARITLGGALHTVQDFYAHTTWVELHPNSFDLAKLGESNIFESSFERPGVLQKTCTPKGLASPIFLTSGFFTFSQPAGNLNYDNAEGKCIHGSSLFTNIGDNPASLSAGINKDKPNRENFGVARGFAIRATRLYVDNILQDLKDKPEDICGLMDQKCDTQVPSAPPPDVVGVWHAKYYGGDLIPFTISDQYGGIHSLLSYSVTLSSSGNYCDTRTGTHLGVAYTDGTCTTDPQAYSYEYEYTYNPLTPKQQDVYLYYTGYPVKTRTPEHLRLSWVNGQWVMNWTYSNWEMTK